MLSKNTIKFIKSLQIKKFRKEHGLFLVEGKKSVIELLHSDYEVTKVITTEKFVEDLKGIQKRNIVIEIENESILEAIGTFDTNNSMIAIAKMKEPYNFNITNKDTVLILDTIKDPGNLGTIIRTADWFGVDKILCSETTAELYSPKVISSTMGSFTRVNLKYCDLENELNILKKDKIEIIGTVLSGTPLSTFAPKPCAIVIGSEAHGISEKIVKQLDKKITIPGAGKTESLNAAVAAGIVLNHFFTGK